MLVISDACVMIIVLLLDLLNLNCNSSSSECSFFMRDVVAGISNTSSYIVDSSSSQGSSDEGLSLVGENERMFQLGGEKQLITITESQKNIKLKKERQVMGSR